MRIRCLIALPVGLVLWVTFPEAARAQGSRAVEEDTIRSLEEQERQAVLKEDVPTLKRLWSEEFIVNNPQNQVSPSRDAVLERVKQGLIHYSAFERRIESVRLNGEIAIVMGGETVEPVGDTPRAGTIVERRFTNIWKKHGATWRLIARHANVILSQ